MYGAVPPCGTTVAVPLAPPKQVVGVVETTDALGPLVLLTGITKLLVQALASVMVKV